jgi:hypothetical protein
MEDFSMLRKFIEDSDFTEEIKDALLKSIMLEMQGSPALSDYTKLVTQLAGGVSLED